MKMCQSVSHIWPLQFIADFTPTELHNIWIGCFNTAFQCTHAITYWHCGHNLRVNKG